MPNFISKTKQLLKEKKQKEFLDKAAAYIRYIFLSVWYRLTLKETDPNLKKVNKNWIVYTWLKSRYNRFLRNYKTQENSVHEYSDTVWWCWFQGEENAPDVAKACLESVRKNMSGKNVIVITEKNMYDYVSMPDFIIEKYKKGIISKTHFSDLLRLELLIQHGGLWIDSTVLCTGNPCYAFNTPLFAFKTNEKNDPATSAQNWFMSSEKNNPVLILTRDLLFAYWKSHNYLIHYFIFYFFMKLAAEKYNEEWNSIPFFSDLPPHILQRELFTKYSDERMAQLERMSDIHKLTYKFKDEASLEKQGTFYEKIMKSYCGKTDAIKIIGGGHRSRVKISGCILSARNYGECA